MKTVSATEAKQAFAGLLDAALREPVTIRRQRRDVAVMMSMAEYERLTQLNVDEFQRFCDKEGAGAAERRLTEDGLQALLRDA